MDLYDRLSRSDGPERLAGVEGHRPAAGPPLERSSVFCRRCGKIFEHLVLEDIKGIVQLRVAGLLVMQVEANCLVCGWRFNWNSREKDVEKMAVLYGEVLAYARNGYMPE